MSDKTQETKTPAGGTAQERTVKAEAAKAAAANEAAIDMTSGSVKGGLVRFAIPIFIGNLFQQLYNMVDSLIVGNFVGSTALAAVSSTGTLLFLLVGFFYGVSMGGGVIIARYIGAKDDENVRIAVHTQVALGLIASVILIVLGVALTPWLLRLMDTPDDVLPEAITYLRIYFAGVFGLVMYNIFVGIMQAAGDSRHPLYYLIFSSLLNIVLDLVFILGFGAGVAGAATATIISQISSAILCLVRLTRIPECYRVELKSIRLDGPTAVSIIKVGIPSGVQNSAQALSNVVIQSYINGFGSSAMAGIGAYVKVEGFAMLPLNALALAMSTYVSQNLGAEKRERVDEGVRFGLIFGLIMTQVIGVFLYLFAPQLIGLFNSDAEVIAFGVGRAHIGTIFFFLFAYTQIISAVLRGCRHAMEPMTIFLIFWCAGRILIMAIGSMFITSVALTYWVFPITWAMSSVACFFVWRHVRRTL